MAVVSCGERFTNEAEFSLENGVSYRREWLVEIDDPANDREQTILNSAMVRNNVQLLRIWEAGQDQDPTTFTTTVRVKQMPEEKTLYIIEVEYGPPPNGDGEGGNQDPQQNPLDDDPEFEYTWASYKRAFPQVFKERTSGSGPLLVKAIGVLNSAKEPFDPQPEVDDDRLVLKFSRNEPHYDVVQALKLANTTNKTALSGAQPGQLLIKPIAAQIKFRNGIWFWKKNYEIHFREEGWNVELLDQGTYYYIGGYAADGVKKHFVDDDGHPTTGLLNGQGNKLGPGEDPVKITLQAYRETEFNDLRLPLPQVPNPRMNRIPGFQPAF